MSIDNKELSRLHELMCNDALEGGLSLDDSVACQRLAERYPQVNTQYYWEALGAADLVLDGSGVEPPPEVCEGWIALSESVGLGRIGEDALDSTVAVWDQGAVNVEQYATERSLGTAESDEGQVWPWVLLLVLALGAGGFWLYPDVSRALQNNEILRQWIGTQQPQGDPKSVLLALTGEEAGRVIWDPVLQSGRLEINTRGMTIGVARQAQVWLVDADRGVQQHVPVALLDPKRTLQTVDFVSPVRIRRYAGLLITSESEGGSLNPSLTHILANHDGTGAE